MKREKKYPGHVVKYGHTGIEWVRPYVFEVWEVHRYAGSAMLPKKILIRVKPHNGRYFSDTRVWQVDGKSVRLMRGGNDCFLRYNDALQFLKESWKERAKEEKKSYDHFKTENAKIQRAKKSAKRESLTLADK